MDIYQAAVAAVCFALALILVARAKLPAFLALLIAAFAFALASRTSLGANGDAISRGFAQTVETVGFAIVAGAIVSAMLERTGAADRLAAALAPARWRRAVAVALGLATSVVPSSAVALALLRPWCDALRGSSPATRADTTVTLALAIGAGQAFVYPSIIAVATGTILKIAPLWLLLMGVPLALAASVAGLLFVSWAAPRMLRAPSPPSGGEGARALSEKLQSMDVLRLALPTLLPIALLSIAGYAQTATEPLGRDGRDILGFYAKPSVILIFCVAIVAATAWRARGDGEGGWLERALARSVWPLLATGIAGGFAAILQNAGMAEMLGERVFALKLGLLVPFIAAALMKALHGSSLVATLTAVGMLEPLLGALGLDAASGRLLAAGAIAAGTLVAHVNDPTFWLVADIAELDAVRTLRLYSAATVVQAAVSIALLWVVGLMLL